MQHSDKNRLKRVYYSSLTSAINQIVAIGCGLIIPKLILDAYGSENNGVVASITQFLKIFSLLQIGIQGATRVALYKSLAKGDEVRTNAIMNANVGYYRKIALWLVFYIVLLAIGMPLLLNTTIDKTVIVYLVIIIGAGNFVQYFWGNAYKALLSADQTMYVINNLQTITIILNAIVCVIVIKSGGSVISAMFWSSVVYALNPLGLFFYVKRKYHFNKDVKPDKSALKGRWDVLANSLANIVNENIDILVISYFCSVIEVSVYAIYSLVSSGLSRLSIVFTSGTEAAFGDMYAKGEKEALNRNFRLYEHMMFCISGIMSGCMYVLILPFIKLYTINVHDANYIRPLYALVLTMALFTMSIRQPYVMMVQAAGHYKQTKMGSFAEAGLHFVLTLILVQVYGIVGAVIGAVVANTFRTIQYGFYVYHHLIPFNPVMFIKRFAWTVFTTTASILASTSCIKIMAGDTWMEWVLLSLICVIVHLGIFGISSISLYKSDTELLLKRVLSK